jgi:hypothetical protein
VLKHLADLKRAMASRDSDPAPSRLFSPDPSRHSDALPLLRVAARVDSALARYTHNQRPSRMTEPESKHQTGYRAIRQIRAHCMRLEMCYPDL